MCLLVRKQPSVGIGCTQLITATGSISLAVESSSNHTVHIAVLVLHNLSLIAGIAEALLQTLCI